MTSPLVSNREKLSCHSIALKMMANNAATTNNLRVRINPGFTQLSQGDGESCPMRGAPLCGEFSTSISAGAGSTKGFYSVPECIMDASLVDRSKTWLFFRWPDNMSQSNRRKK